MVAAAIAAILAAAPSPARAHAGGSADEMVIPAGSLGEAIAIISTHTGTSIGTTDPDLLALRISRMRVSGPPPQILRKLLGARAVLRPVPGGWMILTAPEPAPRAVAAPELRYETGIRVTGSRTDAPAPVELRAAVRTLDGDTLDPLEARRGAEALLARVPMLSATHLGPGQYKLFLRGIADSGVAGTRAAALGRYWNDIPLGYRAPDPDLLPYDVAQITFLPGPRSVLDGIGGLGGAIRTETAAPDSARRYGRVWAGIASTAHGAPGGDAGAMLNLPLAGDALALRAVAYHVTDGGIVDDPGRRAHDTDAVRTDGGRLALRWQRDGWTLDLTGAAQDVHADDAHYIDPAQPGRTHRSPFAEPSSDRVRIAGATLRGAIGALDFRSVIGVTHQQVARDQALADPERQPLLHHWEEDAWLLRSDTRVAHQSASGLGWLAGIELLASRDRQREAFSGGMDATLLREQVRDRSASLYGAVRFAATPRLEIEAGLRQANLWLDGWATGTLPTYYFKYDDTPVRVHRYEGRLLPSLAAERRLANGGALYARYARGFRPGGIAAGLRAAEFRSDAIDTIETGVRDTRLGALKLSAGLALSRWHHVQSDLMAGAGIAYTANIGDATILTGDAALSWQASPRLAIDVAAMAADVRVDPALPGLEARDAHLPDVPDVSANGSLRYALPVARATDALLRASLRYLGRSWAGAGPLLAQRQGGYATADMSATVRWRGIGFSLAAENLLNATGTAFAYGRIVTISGAAQRVVQHPRTIRAGIDMNF